MGQPKIKTINKYYTPRFDIAAGQNILKVPIVDKPSYIFDPDKTICCISEVHLSYIRTWLSQSSYVWEIIPSTVPEGYKVVDN
ncbi:hypothetical protein KAR91_31440 [Candidatus Pacearchaeota archaeon]|nr:hypothetical protein [Candidatus Pacearchaeota archaeon]